MVKHAPSWSFHDKDGECVSGCGEVFIQPHLRLNFVTWRSVEEQWELGGNHKFTRKQSLFPGTVNIHSPVHCVLHMTGVDIRRHGDAKDLKTWSKKGSSWQDHECVIYWGCVVGDNKSHNTTPLFSGTKQIAVDFQESPSNVLWLTLIYCYR